MQLLGVLGVGPAWRYPRRRALEGEAPVARLEAADDHPVLAVLGDAHAQDIRVERGERAGIRAVEHGLLHPTDHARIMTVRGAARECVSVARWSSISGG